MDSESDSSVQDGYEQDGFVVPDEPLDDNISDEEVIPKKRRTRLKKNDTDDLQLLQDNFGLSAEPKSEKKSKKFQSSSESESLEPGEIPDVYCQGVQIAASIFGTGSVNVPSEERKIDFEPADKREKYIRSEDDVIRDSDMPERLQSIFKGRETPNETEINLESEWFFSKIIMKINTSNPSALKFKISKFLYMYRVEKYEIPFIAKYRMHALKPELECDLWELQNWDREWSFLYSSKQSFKALYQQAEANLQVLAKGKVLENNEKVLSRPCSEIVQELNLYPIHYIYHLGDLEAFFKVHIFNYSLGKQTLKNYNPVQELRKNNLNYFTSKAALTPEQFSENLKALNNVHIAVKPNAKPQDLAFELLCSTFTEELQVINAACSLMKSELAALPSIRSQIRDMYLKYLRIFTSPTEKGKTILDVFHPYYRVKNLLEGKAFNTWTPDLWGEVLKCEELGLINLEFKVPWENDKDDKVLEAVKSFYLTSNEDEIESDWNTFRLQVLKQALGQIYAETMEIVRKDLTMATEEWVKTQVQANFFSIISAGKIKQESGAVMAFATDPDTQMYGHSYMVILNNYGGVMEVANFNTLTLRKEEGLHDSDKARSKKDKSQLAKTILQYQPDAVLIAANSLQAITLRKNIMTIIETLQSDNFNEAELEFEVDRSALLNATIPVYMTDPQVPKLFASSQRSKRMFPEYKLLTRMAISLARMAQNPCAETLSLASDPNEVQIKYLNFHPLQSLLSEMSLMSALEVVALDFISHTGVDLNEIMHRSHLSVLINYVPGLGPIKSAGLIESLKQKSNGKLLMRAQLIGKRILGNRVFENAAGFIKIPYEEKESDPLDSTRIHPESYDLAKVIARSVFSDSHIRDESLIQEVMARPQKMQELDLEKYSEIHLAKTGNNIKLVLEMIISELSSPFYVPEKKFSEICADDLFYLCTGENKNSLKKGTILQACVTGFDERKMVLKCRLECGVEAIADSKMIPEKKGEKSEQFAKGEVVTARVVDLSSKVQGKDIFFRIKLSMLQDDIINHGKFIQLALDDAFIMDDSDWIEKAVMEDEYRTGQKYVPRVVNHPKFKNISFQTACEELLNKDIGDCVFRPSSRGQDHLTCTWKFYDFIYAHLDIIEEGKPAVNMLGTKFRISSDVFESLQEILDRYVGPCEKLTKEAISHAKFKDTISGGVRLIENLLTSEKKARPTSIPYYFTIRPEYPQFIVLYYMPKEEITTEFIKVKPKGLFFHEAYHPNINFLISWFKRHYSDRTYKAQLSRSKPPIIDTSNHMCIAGKVPVEEKKTESWNDENTKPMTPRNQPDATPYTKTPHIGYQEWAGGKEINKTPRADDWEMARNYDSWGPKTPVPDAVHEDSKTEQNTSSGWGEPTTTKWGDVPPVPSTNWADEAKEEGRGRGRGRGRGCRNCGEDGHMAKECTSEKKSSTCFNCGGSGHMSRECPNPKAEKPAGRACFNCGDSGHMSKECPNPKAEKSAPRACFNCGDSGHMSRECPNPKDETRARRPRGRGRGGRRESANDDSSSSNPWGDSSNNNPGWGGSNENAAWGAESNQNSGWGGGNSENVGAESKKETSAWGDSSNNSWGQKNNWAEEKKTESNEWGKPSHSENSAWGNSENKSGWGETSNEASVMKKEENKAWGDPDANQNSGSWGGNSSW